MRLPPSASTVICVPRRLENQWFRDGCSVQGRRFSPMGTSTETRPCRRAAPALLPPVQAVLATARPPKQRIKRSTSCACTASASSGMNFSTVPERRCLRRAPRYVVSIGSVTSLRQSFRTAVPLQRTGHRYSRPAAETYYAFQAMTCARNSATAPFTARVYYLKLSGAVLRRPFLFSRRPNFFFPFGLL